MFPLTNLLRNLASHPGYFFKQTMVSFVTAILTSFAATVLKGTLGLLDMKARRYVAGKLRDGDVVEQKLCSLIVTKLERIKLKLDAEAQSDLKASFSSLKEGFIFLDTVLDKDQSGDDSTETSDEGSEAGRSLPSDSNTSAASSGCNISSLIEEMKNLDISNLGDSQKRALIKAKKRFDEARAHAMLALNNDGLNILHRVLAMNVRLSATILAEVENPVCVLPVCRSCLEELHAMQQVENNFLTAVKNKAKSKIYKEELGQIISAVCQINRLVYDVTKMVGDGKGLLLWPYIKVKDEKIDPLRDSRVARILLKQNMNHYCLARSFGQQEDEEQQSLKSATGIATNSLGHFLVIDKVHGVIKVFDTTGKFLSSFTVLPQEGVVSKVELESIDTDGNNNIYVLTTQNSIFVFEKPESNSSKKIFHCGKSEGKAKIVRVMRDHGSLFLGVEVELSDSPSERLVKCQYIVFRYKMVNEGKANWALTGKSVLIGMSNLVDVLITSDNHAVILDSDCVYVISDCKSKVDVGKKGTDKRFEVVDARAIAYHQISEKIVIVSHSENAEIPSKVLICDKDGTIDRSIHFEVEKNYHIKGVSVTRDGVICISANSEHPPKGKVIVL